jgi:metal-responsive CopG/Arc/MetJ family transcriptional regulator
MVHKKENMRRTSIDLTDDQYFFLKKKAMSQQKKGKSPTIVAIIRELIERDRKNWSEEKK